jgi:hypothetical protein
MKLYSKIRPTALLCRSEISKRSKNPCYDGSDEIDQRRDKIRNRIVAANETYFLSQMIERLDDIEATVAGLAPLVPV